MISCDVCKNEIPDLLNVSEYENPVTCRKYHVCPHCNYDIEQAASAAIEAAALQHETHKGM